MKSSSIQVLVAEDHTLVREGFCSLLRSIPNVQVLTEVGNGQEALTLAKECHPDVAILDISMPGLNGLEVAQRLHRESPDIRVIILSMHANEDYIRKALQAGVKGYLLKGAEVIELETAIRSVIQGQHYFSAQVSSHIIQEYIKTSSSQHHTQKDLTSRQREILQLIAEGHSTKEIAHLLKLSVKTVETHRMQLMERLQIYHIPGLVRYAIRIGLISAEL